MWKTNKIMRRWRECFAELLNGSDGEKEEKTIDYEE
jgi:hypothetical protein